MQVPRFCNCFKKTLRCLCVIRNRQMNVRSGTRCICYILLALKIIPTRVSGFVYSLKNGGFLFAER